MTRVRTTVSPSSTLSISTLLRRRGADRLQGGRELAADRHRRLRVAEHARGGCRRRGRPCAPSASTTSSVSHGSAIRSTSRCASWRLASTPADRIASLRHLRGVVFQQLAQLAIEHVGDQADDPRRLEPRLRRPASPVSPTMRCSISCAASRFCARPGRARNAIIEARIEKSGKSPTCSMSVERIGVGMARQIEQRLGPHLEMRDRRAAARRRGAPRARWRARAGRRRGVRTSADSCASRPGTAGCTPRVLDASNTLERVEDLGGVAAQPLRPGPRWHGGRASARGRAPRRRGAGGCSPAGWST